MAKIFVKRFFVLGALAFVFGFLPHHAFAARYYVDPSSGAYANGDRFTVTLYIDTQGDAVNAAEGTFSFPTRSLKVESVSSAGSVFKFWSQDPAYSNTSGNVSFGGGLPSPGVSSPSAKVLTITFRALGVGSATLHLESGDILANDGLGTNVLTGSADGSYTITDGSAPPPPSESSPEETTPPPTATSGSTDTPGKPHVSSATHPDENTWYNANKLELSWELPKDVTGVSYGLFDSTKHSLAESNRGLVSGTSYDLTKYDDGIWYFYIKFQNANGWGGTLKRRVNIDRTPPGHFTVVRKTSDDPTDPQPIFTWSADDAASGIDRYEFKVDGGAFADAAPLAASDGTYHLPVTGPGGHVLSVQAYDHAGNTTEADNNFVIAPIAMPVITDYTKTIAAPGDAFAARGTSLPKVIITLMLVSDNKTITLTTAADENGYWTLTSREHIGAGTWKLQAKATDARGAESNLTPSVQVRSASLFGNILPFIFEWGGTILAILAALALLVAIAMYMMHRIRLWRWMLKRDLKAFKVELQKDLAELEDDLGPLKEAKKTSQGTRERVRRKVAKLESDVAREIEKL